MIGDAFYTALKAQIGSAKAYPVMAAKNAVAPFVVYQLIDTERDRTLSGESKRNVNTYRINVYHSVHAQAESISNDIANGLLAYNTAPIQYVSIEGEQDASDISGDPNLYRWMIEVRVTYSG